MCFAWQNEHCEKCQKCAGDGRFRRSVSAQKMLRQKMVVYLEENVVSQERENKFDYLRSKSGYYHYDAIFRIILKSESGEIRYDCGTRDVKNPLRMLHSLWKVARNPLFKSYSRSKSRANARKIAVPETALGKMPRNITQIASNH